jgi:UDP-GlcNAc3NAcA epimerase
LQDIFESLVLVATKHKTTIVLPLHPRTAAILEKSLPQDLLSEIKNNEKIILLEPLSFLQMLLLEKNAKLIMTDSGGVQKEAYFLNKPAVVLRSETEWVEIVEEGAARVVDANKQAIIDAADYFIGNENINYPNVFGDGKSSEFICKMMVDNL